MHFHVNILPLSAGCKRCLAGLCPSPSRLRTAARHLSGWPPPALHSADPGGVGGNSRDSGPSAPGLHSPPSRRGPGARAERPSGCSASLKPREGAFPEVRSHAGRSASGQFPHFWPHFPPQIRWNRHTSSLHQQSWHLHVPRTVHTIPGWAQGCMNASISLPGLPSGHPPPDCQGLRT